MDYGMLRGMKLSEVPKATSQRYLLGGVVAAGCSPCFLHGQDWLGIGCNRIVLGVGV